MKLLQRILSRGLLISVAILAAIAFHFRATLFPQWYGPGAETQQTAQVEEASPSAPVAADRDATVPQQGVMTPDSAAASTQAPVNPDMPPLVENVPNPNAGDQSAAVDDVPMAAERNIPAQTAAAAEAATAPIAPVAPSTAVSAALSAAREAFWQQDFEAAETFYREAAVADANNADALGELGNIYYAQGRWSDAAEAYAGAVERLLESGEQQRAGYLMTVLDGLDPARAQAVRTSVTRGGS